MKKPKRKLTSAEKAARQKRRQEFMTIFVNGKQKRVRRPPAIDGIPVDEFIRCNADPIWLHQNEMWELIESHEVMGDSTSDQAKGEPPHRLSRSREDDELPF